MSWPNTASAAGGRSRPWRWKRWHRSRAQATSVALALAVCLAPGPGRCDGAIAARILDEDIPGERLGAQAAPEAQARALAQIAYDRLTQDFIRRNALTATPAELAELDDYNQRFRRHDRAQRARKLEELKQRIQSPQLDAGERARAQDFLATLERLARYDVEADAGPQPTPEEVASENAPWIERWKLNVALYARFGGAVGIAASGMEPFGALAALLHEYAAQGRLQIFEPELAQRLWRIVDAAPAMPVPPAKVEFTPYWRQPIPSSSY